MTLAKITDLFNETKTKNYLVGILECWNYESALAIVNIAEEKKKPVVLFTGDPAVRLLGMKNLATMMLNIAENASVPVACHIEAVNDYSILIEAIKYGFPSVIYDASELPLEENIRNTKKLVEIAHLMGVEVEAQIGSMPFSATGSGYENINFDLYKTKIEEAERFAHETGIDILAPNLGNVHGLYKQKVKTIDIDLANRLVEKIGLPITLHGGTGIPDEIIREAKKTKLSAMYYATTLFENFRNCIKENIDSKTGYGSYAEILIGCKKNFEDFIRTKFDLLYSV